MYFHHHHYQYMPQPRISDEKVKEVRDLRKKGYTYRQIHKVSRVSMGKIAEICEKERPVKTLNSLTSQVMDMDKNMLELEKQLIAVRDRLLEDIISADHDFICPNCSSEFMVFNEDKKPFMRCPRCDYQIVFGSI